MHVRACLEVLEMAGVSASRLLSVAAVDARMLHDDAWLEVEELERLVAAGIELSGDPAFGLHWGERSTGMKFGVMAPLMANARTLRVAIRDMLRYTRIVHEHVPVSFAKTPTRGVLKLNGSASSTSRLPAFAEMGMVGLLRLVQYFGGFADASLVAHFVHSEPEYAHEYVRIFRAVEVRFGQPYTGLEFDCSLLDRPQLYWSAELYHAVIEAAEHELARAMTDTPAERVRNLLLRSAPECPAMKDVARELRLSERSLRRRLAEEGLTYSDVVTQVRRATARQLLARSSIKETAHAMGFANATAFQRAFRRWTGTSAGEYQRMTVERA
jgi:AraC-like DNA-binding protein